MDRPWPSALRNARLGSLAPMPEHELGGAAAADSGQRRARPLRKSAALVCQRSARPLRDTPVVARAAVWGRSGRGVRAAPRHHKPAPVRWGRGGDRTAGVPALRADVDAMYGSASPADVVRIRTLSRGVGSPKAIHAAIDTPDLMLRSGDRSECAIGSSIALRLPLLLAPVVQIVRSGGHSGSSNRNKCCRCARRLAV
jgi:hypothetical protein